MLNHIQIIPLLKKKINDAIGNFIAVGNYPFSIVEN